MKMDKKIVLDDVGDEGSSIDISCRDAAALHHSFVGLIERMWKAIKHRDKPPFKDMNLPEIDLTDFKMKITENVETYNGSTVTSAVVRFYVRNVFVDNGLKWFSFREMTLKTFLPYDDYVTGRYDFDSMWRWFRQVKAPDMKLYKHLYDEAQYLTWYLNACVKDFLINNIHTA